MGDKCKKHTRKPNGYGDKHTKERNQILLRFICAVYEGNIKTHTKSMINALFTHIHQKKRVFLSPHKKYNIKAVLMLHLTTNQKQT